MIHARTQSLSEGSFVIDLSWHMPCFDLFSVTSTLFCCYWNTRWSQLDFISVQVRGIQDRPNNRELFRPVVCFHSRSTGGFTYLLTDAGSPSPSCRCPRCLFCHSLLGRRRVGRHIGYLQEDSLLRERRVLLFGEFSDSIKYAQTSDATTAFEIKFKPDTSQLFNN